MPDTTPEQILARAQVPPANGRPIRKDEIELDERGIYIESWLPERRSRRKPLLFVHGELAGSWVWERYLGYFAARGWEGHALNLRNHFWSQTADPATLSFDTYTEDVVATLERFGSGVGGRRARHGRPARAQGRRADADLRAWCCSAPSCRASCGRPARPHELREIPEVYGTLDDRLGDAARAPAPGRARPDPGRRPAHPAPARPEAARGRRRASPDARRRADRPARRRRAAAARRRRRAGPDRCRWPTRSAWPSGSTPDYEPFAAHSHYGLVVGENSYQQVADAIRGFLEVNRL